MLSDLPIPQTSSDLVLLAVYVGAALVLGLYAYLTFIAPKIRAYSKPDYEEKTRDLLVRYRAQELQGDPDYLLPGEFDEADPPPASSSRVRLGTTPGAGP